MNFLFFAIGLIGILCSIMLIVGIRRSFLRWIGGVSEWAWACVLMIAASLLFGEGTLRSTGGVRLCANVAMFAAFLMMYVSLGKMAAQATIPAYRTLLGVVVGAAVLLAWFTFIHNDYAGRAVCVLLVHGILFLACAFAVLGMKLRHFPEYFTFCAFLFLAGISLLRFIAVVVGYEHSDVLEAASTYQVTYLRIFASGILAVIIGYMLIVGTRLHDTLRRLASFGAFDKIRDRDRSELEHDLNRAVEKTQLILHYQPRVSMRTGMIVGVEALLRWDHPHRGLLLPNVFIPIGEDNGAIASIGEWVLGEAARVLNRLHSEGSPGINMSINVSAKQIASAILPDQIEKLLRDAKFEARQIELELTESSVIEDQVSAAQVMAKLKSLGVRLSVDDFGTGYSSLAYIKSWPLDCVKIDRGFVSDICSDAGDLAITRAIIAMGHALGLNVVAEGVENSEQLAYLRDLGCDEYQGYLVSEPVSESELFPLLAAHAVRIGEHPQRSGSVDLLEAIVV